MQANNDQQGARILPQAERPFFPGQAIRSLVEPSAWVETIRAAQ
jgi:hypothetical protein